MPRRRTTWTTAALLLPAVVTTLGGGCNRGPEIVPVAGRVFYKGAPLKFGSVMFQPDSGQPARGQIQEDGTFALSTYAPNDGAKVGRHRVRITCYTSQHPDAQANRAGGALSLGKLLIPARYTKYATSGFEINVRGDGNDPVEFHLTDP